MRSFRATRNLLAVSANSKETAINTEQTLDTTMLVEMTDVINLEPRRESNADEQTGKEEADAVYDLGNMSGGPLTFNKAQPQHFALLMAYALGTVYSSAAGTGYEHKITPIDGDEDADRSVPGFTAGQRLGATVLKRLFASLFVDSFNAVFAADDWCKISATLKGTGKVTNNTTEESIAANDNVTSLTLAANAVQGSNAADRLANVQRIKAYYNGAWREVTYSAVSAATPAVITIVSVGGAGASITYKVLYIPTESAWCTFPARVTETPLRVAEITIKLGATWIDSITNGTMELDSNWADVGTPAANVRSDAQAYSGTYSHKFTPDAADEGIKSDAFTTITGIMYHGELWVYPDDTTAVTVTVRCGDDSGDVFDQSFTVVQDAWNKIVFSYEETAGGALAYLKIDSGAAAAGDFYVDLVSLCSFQGGREMDAEIKSVEWAYNNNLEITFSPGAGDSYAARCFRPARNQTIRLNREMREYILQQHIDDNDDFGLYILAEGAVYNSAHKYQVAIVFPKVAVLTSPISVDGKVNAEAGDLLVLQDDTYGSVIAYVKNLQASYAA